MSDFHKRWLKWFLGFFLPICWFPILILLSKPTDSYNVFLSILLEILQLTGATYLSYKTAKSLQQAEETYGKLRWKLFWFHLFVEMLLLCFVIGIPDAINDGRSIPQWFLKVFIWAGGYAMINAFPSITNGNFQEPRIYIARVLIFGLVLVFGYGLGIVTNSHQSPYLVYPMFMFAPMIAYGSSSFVAPSLKDKRTTLKYRMLKASAYGVLAILVLQVDFFLSARGIFVLIVIAGLYLRYKYRPKQKNDAEMVA